MLRLAADENFNAGIIIVTVQDAGLSGSDDRAVREWAARDDRIVLTHDVTTLIGYALDRVAAGQPMPGVFAVRSDGPIGSTIEDIALLAECSEEDEWDGQVCFLPL